MPRTPQASKTVLGLLISFLIVSGLLVIHNPGHAETAQAYVSNLTITVRRGPGIDYKIIAFLNPGDEVDEIGRESGWARVRFGQNRTGWVLERYLTETPSPVSRKDELLARNESLKGTVSVLERSNASLRAYFDKPAQMAPEKEASRYHSAQELARALTLAKRLLREESLKVRFFREQREIEDELGRWFLLGSGMAGLGMVLGVLTFRSRLWFKLR